MGRPGTKEKGNGSGGRRIAGKEEEFTMKEKKFTDRRKDQVYGVK